MGMEEIKAILGFGGLGLAAIMIFFQDRKDKRAYQKDLAFNKTLNNHFKHMENATNKNTESNTKLSLAIDNNSQVTKEVFRAISNLNK